MCWTFKRIRNNFWGRGHSNGSIKKIIEKMKNIEATTIKQCKMQSRILKVMNTIVLRLISLQLCIYKIQDNITSIENGCKASME